ncbi:MAG: hypothetical protein AAF740_10490 [Bacteroidota bacterium]
MEKVDITLRNALLVTILLISFQVHGQKQDSVLIHQFDSLISKVETQAEKNEHFHTTQASGSMCKKVLGIFNRSIGGFHHDVIYHDTLVYKIENVHSYTKEKRMLVETFYYQENQLIKYVETKKLDIEEAKSYSLEHEIIAYFDGDKLIKLSKIVNDDFEFSSMELHEVMRRAKDMRVFYQRYLSVYD